MVAHALEVLGTEQEMNARRDAPRVFRHLCHELARQSGAKPIDILVARPYVERRFGVTLDQAGEHAVQLPEHGEGHASEPMCRTWRHIAVAHGENAPADVLREIADAR